VDRLDGTLLIGHPLGQLIDGQAWIRSPQAVLPDGSITFYAQILPGLELHLMRVTNLVADTRAAVASARAALGGPASGGVMFNCILRRLEIDARDDGPAFLQAFQGLPLAGFHTYGESWLGHVNQSLAGIVFGTPGGAS
jgi:hypothetical protein